MRYIVTALYAEAKPIIERYQLKKDGQQSKLQLFSGEDIRLVVGGTGEIAAAVATAHLLTKYPCRPNDLILNIGSGGSLRFPHGTAVLCHKIIQHATGNAYYPDILFKHPFAEGSVETFPRPVDKEREETVRGDIVDMESSGFFQAAASFLPPEQIMVLKIVSDALSPQEWTAKAVSAMIGKHLPALEEMWRSVADHLIEPEVLTESEQRLLENIGRALKLTETMRHELFRLAQQYKIAQGNDLAFLQAYEKASVKTKQEGKSVYGQLKQRLLPS